MNGWRIIPVEIIAQNDDSTKFITQGHQIWSELTWEFDSISGIDSWYQYTVNRALDEFRDKINHTFWTIVSFLYTTYICAQSSLNMNYYVTQIDTDDTAILVNDLMSQSETLVLGGIPNWCFELSLWLANALDSTFLWAWSGAELASISKPI